MIAVALGLISMVVMVATGVVVSSSGTDRLAFLGVAVETTTAQVFVTGAIFAWLFLVALWLLRVGMQRSVVRSVELAGRWSGLAAWLGLGSGRELAGELGGDFAGKLSGELRGGSSRQWADRGGGAAGSGTDDGGAPQGVDGGGDVADRVVGAPAADEPGVLPRYGVAGPGAGIAVVGIGVEGRGQGGEIGG